MFAKRSKKSKDKNKRKRIESNENQSNDDEDDSQIIKIKSNKPSLNQFSTNVGSKKINLVDDRTIQSERGIVPQKYAGDATYESLIDTEKDRDARAILEKNIEMNKNENEESGKIYRGQAGYKNYIQKDEAQVGMNKYTGTQGPIRAQTWARSICRFDYQPDICKDYKETGFCGYGDSCKFMHDRGDYKSGWQIEKEFEEKQKQKQKMLMEGKSIEDSDDDDDKYVIHSDDEIEQFACTICKEEFHNAVETTCGHYFCEKCALENFKKSSRCFNCGKQTNGVFNVCTKLREREAKENADDSEDETKQKSFVESGGSWSVVS